MFVGMVIFTRVIVVLVLIWIIVTGFLLVHGLKMDGVLKEETAIPLEIMRVKG